MRVLWSALALVAGLSVVTDGQNLARLRVTPVTSPDLPLLTLADMEYLGSFKVPTGTSNGVEFSSSAPRIAYNPATDELYASAGNPTKVASITTPTPVIGAVAALPRASYVQNFYDIAEGTLPPDGTCGNSANTTGLLVYGGLLHASYDCYFDGAPTQSTSQFTHSLTLSTSSVTPLTRLGPVGEQHAVSFSLASIPAVWQGPLGSKALANGWGGSLISNGQSSGPNAIGFDPADINGSGSPATSVPLLNYPIAHTTVGTWGNALFDDPTPTPNQIFSMNAIPGGMAIIKGTRTLMHVYQSMTADAVGCYGTPTANLALQGEPAPEGSHYCYDPYHAGEAKTVNAYDPAIAPPDTPHIYFYALYDLNDLVTAKNSGNVWVPVPYESGELTSVLPLSWPTGRMGGISYDYDSNQMYVVLRDVEESAPNINYPVISVLTFNP